MTDPSNTPALPSLGEAVARYERNARCRNANKRRLRDIPLSPQEIRFDLTDLLVNLITHVKLCGQKDGLFQVHDQVFDYVERATSDALVDYPRNFERNVHVQGLWDALCRIRTLVEIWHKTRDKDAAVLCSAIEKVARQATMGDYPRLKRDS